MRNNQQQRPETPEHDPVCVAEVLVVDDDPNVAALLEEFLQEEGFAVWSANDGLRAISMIEHIRPKVVLADVMMPRMDGFTLANEVRKRWSTIEVILMSASETPVSVQMPVIQKPFDLDVVRDAIISCANCDYDSASNRI